LSLKQLFAVLGEDFPIEYTIITVDVFDMMIEASGTCFKSNLRFKSGFGRSRFLQMTPEESTEMVNPKGGAIVMTFGLSAASESDQAGSTRDHLINRYKVTRLISIF
jgi:hypothetical protein